MASLETNAFKKQGRPRLPALYPAGKTETTKKYLGPWHGAPHKKTLRELNSRQESITIYIKQYT